VSASVFHVGGGRDFVLYGDSEFFSDDPISDCDLEPITVDGPSFARMISEVWSCGIAWFFVVAFDSILLLNTSGQGVRCRKLSYDFIRQFVDSPEVKRGRKRK
jgi:hypothetical protein